VPSLSVTVGALLSELMRGDDLDRPRAAPIIAVARREASRIVLQLSTRSGQAQLSNRCERSKYRTVELLRRRAAELRRLSQLASVLLDASSPYTQQARAR